MQSHVLSERRQPPPALPSIAQHGSGRCQAPPGMLLRRSSPVSARTFQLGNSVPPRLPPPHLLPFGHALEQSEDIRNDRRKGVPASTPFSSSYNRSASHAIEQAESNRKEVAGTTKQGTSSYGDRGRYGASPSVRSLVPFGRPNVFSTMLRGSF